MAYVYRDGKVVTISTANVKLPKEFIKKVDENKKSAETIKKAIETIKKAKVKYAF